jgi:hypothetical protein
LIHGVTDGFNGLPSDSTRRLIVIFKAFLMFILAVLLPLRCLGADLLTSSP